VTNDPEDWLLTAQERGNPATILHERHVDKGSRPTGNQVRAADLAARGHCLYCVPFSCIAALPGDHRLCTERSANSASFDQRHPLPGPPALLSRRVILEADAAKASSDLRRAARSLVERGDLPPWCHAT
jgi:hypothetical protein